MKFVTKLSLLFLVAIFFLNCSSEKGELLEIEGQTVGTDTKSIILLKQNQDPRQDSIIEIPVINGKFHYQAKIEHPEAVRLYIDKKSRKSMTLFLENEKINLTIYSEEEFDKNIVTGGKLNAEYKKYKDSFNLKFNTKTRPYKDSLSIALKNDIIQKEDTPNIKNSKLNPEKQIFKHEYMKKNNTIVSYYFLLKDLNNYVHYKSFFNQETIDIDLAKKTFKRLKKTFPNHPYNELVRDLIYGITNVKVGEKYINFSAPDLNGNMIKLSDKIKGKVALLNLWATWCGPCILKSRRMNAIYNEYKDKGFTIIGVAGEFKNTDNLVKFLEKEKWEWLNLVEIDRKNNIWHKYGIGNVAGGVFLIDENGVIIAINPMAYEVRKELEARLVKYPK